MQDFAVLEFIPENKNKYGGINFNVSSYLPCAPQSAQKMQARLPHGKNDDMTHYPNLAALALLFIKLTSPAFAAGNPNNGAIIYQKKCAACHSIDYNGVGPAHVGLFNRKAGSQADYSYSPAVSASPILWNEKTLDKWLTNPEKLIPGQKMGFLVPSPKERADLIAYLKIAAVQK